MNSWLLREKLSKRIDHKVFLQFNCDYETMKENVVLSCFFCVSVGPRKLNCRQKYRLKGWSCIHTHPPWVTIHKPSLCTMKSPRIFPMSSAQSGMNVFSQCLAKQPQKACKVTMRPHVTFSSSNILLATFLIRVSCSLLCTSSVCTSSAIIPARALIVSFTKSLITDALRDGAWQ